MNSKIDKNWENQLPLNPEILFINPDRNMTGERIVHQGISSIAAYLFESGIESHALLTSLCNDDFIIEMIEKYPYKYVGFFITSDPTSVNYSKKMINRIKAKRNDIIYLSGGPHPTLGSEDLMKDIPDMDICVRGEGEKTVVELLTGSKLEDIKGISYRKNDKLVHNIDRPLLTAQELSVPLRNIYINTDWNAHSLSTSRGCPNNCHFCIGHEIFGRTIRFKPLERIDQELKWIFDHGDITQIISINDDMFNMRKDRTLALMEIFKKYPFKYFPRGVRADRLDAETTAAMREAGIVGTSIGIESADNNSLKAMCKGETIEQIERGIGHLRNNGIGIVAQFIIGNIGDTLETVIKTIDFALKHNFEGINMSCAIPFPGTALREFVLGNNLMLKEPVQAATGVINGATTIYFETPQFSVAERIEAVQLAIDAGLMKFKESEKVVCDTMQC